MSIQRMLLVVSALLILGCEQDTAELAKQVLRPSRQAIVTGFGEAIAVDRGVAAIGARHQRLVYVFRERDGSWSEEAVIEAPDSTLSRDFGHVLAISGDTIAMSGWADQIPGESPPIASAVFVFRFIENEWHLEARILDDEPAIETRFGVSVALRDDLLVVGGRTVQVFRRSSNVWSRTTRLEGPTDAMSSAFGVSVCLGREFIAVGASNETVDGVDHVGAVYVFRAGPDIWSQTARLVATDTPIRGSFGSPLACTDDLIAAGAPAGPDFAVGRAYVFSLEGSAWIRVSALSASDPAMGDQFGEAIAIASDLTVVGAPGRSALVPQGGAGFVFERDDAGFELTRELVAYEPVDGDRAGAAVAVAGSTIFVGVPGQIAREPAFQGSVLLVSTR